MIIGVTALARAGKDTFADYLVSKYGFSKLNMSDVLTEELGRLGRPQTKDQMSLLGGEWRKQYGMDIVIRRTLEKAEKQEKTIITGFRSIEEVEFMKANSGNFYLVAIIADMDVRFGRKNELDPDTLEGFTARDERDVQKKGLGKVIEKADYKLANNYKTTEEFYKDIDALMQKIRK